MAEKLSAVELAAPDSEPVRRLLDLVRDLVLELHPHKRPSPRPSLDADLDRDLGLDSLGRTELLLRVERTFGVRLAETALAEADSVGDILRAVIAAEPSGRLSALATARAPPRGAAEPAPAEARTLTEVLDWHARHHAERPHVVLSSGSGAEQTVTYRALADAARSVACGLERWGLAVGERAAIMLPTSEDFFTAYFAILYAGGIPVPIYPPTRLSQIEDHLRRQAAILDNAGVVILITVPEARSLALVLKVRVRSLRSVDTIAELRAPVTGGLLAPAKPADTALLQYTSGSTGDPKGVVLSHANLLANIRAMGQAMSAAPSDVFVSWLPLYHDMGLIGAWLGSLYFAVPVVILSPLTFLARPASWLWAIHRHRGTLSGAPNFAFELCARKIDEDELRGLDLSSLRIVVNGAEPVSAKTLLRFTERFERYGFRAEALAPVYGLAESSVGLAFPPPGRRPIVDRIQRDPFSRRGEAAAAAADDPGALEFVAGGHPLPGHQIRIVDSAGRELPERREGRLQFRGPSSTSGYFGDAASTRRLFDGSWAETSDRAYIAAGDVYLTGRIKDIIIRAGRNIYPQEVEEAIGNIDGVRKGCVAVFGSPDPATGTERIVVLAETREADRDVRGRLRQRIHEITAELLEAAADEVVLAPPHTVLKTSSGKIRRAASRELFESGRIGARPMPVWWRLARLALASLAPQVGRWRRAGADLAFAAYWWAWLGVLAGLTWPLVLILPRRRWRWRILRGAARLFLRATGTRPAIEGLTRLPESGSVVVANHASYLDSLVLVATLPGEIVFAAKQELAAQAFAGPFLRRLGILFVERFDRDRGLEDVRTALELAEAGRRLVFYPEGTLTRRPGLLEFRLGAFAVAARAAVAVVPITIQGTRSILRGGQWLPRPGRVRVTIGEILTAQSGDWAAALGLRDRARAEILARCGEPDLAGESAPVFEAHRAG